MGRDPSKTARTLAALSRPDGKGLGVGDISFDEEGYLTTVSTNGNLDFQFAYMGYQFAVRAESDETQTAMRVHAMLGHLPYTAEAPDLRANVSAILNAASNTLGGRITLMQDQRIMLKEDFLFDGVLTPQTLFSKTVTFLLRAKPYLELLSMMTDASDVRQRGAALAN